MISFLSALKDFPEAVGIIALSLALGHVPLLWGRVIILSLAVTAALYLFRLLHFDYGALVLIEIVLLSIIIAKLTNVLLTKSIIIVTSSTVILVALKYLTGYFNLNMDSFNMIGLLRVLFMIIIAELVLIFSKPIQDAWKRYPKIVFLKGSGF
jgi:hypothetical protein